MAGWRDGGRGAEGWEVGRMRTGNAPGKPGRLKEEEGGLGMRDSPGRRKGGRVTRVRVSVNYKIGNLTSFAQEFREEASGVGACWRKGANLFRVIAVGCGTGYSSSTVLGI
jgi:hypothetical protein